MTKFAIVNVCLNEHHKPLQNRTHVDNVDSFYGIQKVSTFINKRQYSSTFVNIPTLKTTTNHNNLLTGINISINIRQHLLFLAPAEK